MSVPDSKNKRQPRPIPERFIASKRTLLWDRVMTRAIQVGGLGIVVSVFGIFLFIGAEVLPLFGRAKVESDVKAELGAIRAVIMGVDEWAERPFLYEGGAEVKFVDFSSGKIVEVLPLALPEGTVVTAWNYDPRKQRVALGTQDGRVGSFTVVYESGEARKKGEKPKVTSSLKVNEFFAIGQQGKPVKAVSFGDGESSKIFAAIQDVDGVMQVHAMTIKAKRTLMGAGKPAVDRTFDLTSQLRAPPERILSSAVGDGLLVADGKGEIGYFFLQSDGELVLRQQWVPFKDASDPRLSSLGFVFGDVSVVATAEGGDQSVFSLYNQAVQRDGKTSEMRLYGQTKTFPKLSKGATFFASGHRNKTFLTGHGKEVSLRYVTTEAVRWSSQLPFEVASAVIDAKTEHLLFLDTAGHLHRYTLHDPHPEAGWKAFFGKIWYEGAQKPEYTWQSTGGTDDFEAKLSLTPLIIGSLKGTVYALLFALPIALLAAVFSACYLPPRIKRVLKPTMEIMASLPSVVLGFLAGLWLAPLIEEKIPSLLLTVIALPVGAMLSGWIWTKAPVHVRSRVGLGNEYLLVLVPMVVFGFIAWSLGPVLEQTFFLVQDPATGKKVADFRLWWPQATGTPFDQRNSLVVGFMMGFAVIPIIFTISEDALSNVPASLKGAAMALGANRWQVVRTIVLPIASAGIFSGLMVGFGRAVGETMIVVMATGNTPVMDMNIFSGMRTLSANIAVELPEAAVHSTHYRALFFGALVLFMLTFVLNTTAELLRQHLRNKFKLV